MLLTLAGHPRVLLRAVTLVPGSAEQVALVRHLLRQLGYSQHDVAVGIATSGKRASRTGTPVSFPGSVSRWHRRAFGDTGVSMDAEPAWRVLRRVCDARTTLVTGGPLTNVADAISPPPLRARHGDSGCADADAAEGGGGGDGRDAALAAGALVVGRWVGQGGFAGTGLVPADAELPKFKGKTRVQTFNFQCNLPAARAALIWQGARRKVLVSKNVCHSPHNLFTRARHAALARVLRRLGSRDERCTSPWTSKGEPRARGAAPADVDGAGARAGAGHDGQSAGSAPCTCSGPAPCRRHRHRRALELIFHGMGVYLEHKDGKLLHDPLAAAVALDEGVAEYQAVAMVEEPRSHQWGAELAPGASTWVTVRHAPDKLWSVLFGGPTDANARAEDRIAELPRTAARVRDGRALVLAVAAALGVAALALAGRRLH